METARSLRRLSPLASGKLSLWQKAVMHLRDIPRWPNRSDLSRLRSTRQSSEESIPVRESESAVKTAPVRKFTFLWILLPTLVLSALAIYYPLARQNLPVALNVDDRTALGVLLRFHQSGANPKFFMYPTLYFYLTYAVTAGFGISRMLLTGHLLNLALLGFTAWLSALFCVRQFKSRVAALVAAVCVLFSPILAESGAYLCTDILLAAMTILSLDYLMLYFRSRDSQDWLYAMLAVGCAIAAKYTAAVLFIVYAVGEVVYIWRSRKNREPGPDAAGESRFARSTVWAGLVVAGLAAALVAVFFPVQAILHFVALHRTNLATRSTQEYFIFLNHLRRLAIELSAGTLLLLVASWRSQTVYECLALKKLYYGLLVLIGVFVVTTPYSVLDPTKFIYDMGALLRANVVVVGNHSQWSEYGHWLFGLENSALVVLGIFGLGLIIYRLSWLSLTPILFAALHVLAICSAHRGFERYLDPLLPLLYCATGLLVHEIWVALAKSGPERRTFVLRFAACVAAIALLGQMIGRTIQNNQAAKGNTAYYTAYEAILKAGSQVQASGSSVGSDLKSEQGKILYAGFVPSIELDLAGFKTQEVSWASLSQGPIGAQLGCSDLLILNVRSAGENHLDADHDGSVEVLFNDSRGQGQMIVRRRDCPYVLPVPRTPV